MFCSLTKFFSCIPLLRYSTTHFVDVVISQGLDEDGKGMLSIKQVCAALARLLGLDSEEEVEPMLRVLGEREEGAPVPFDQFELVMEKGVPGGYLTWWHRIQILKISKEVFELIDVDGSGIRDELR